MELAVIRIEGVVQGVGFRPTVCRLAAAQGITGSIKNSPSGVEILIAAPLRTAQEFAKSIEKHSPPAAVITSITVTPLEALDDSGGLGRLPPDLEGLILVPEEFLIADSTTGGARRAVVPPDLYTCPDCLAELMNPADRRFRYPFINCTNCGPRYSIITTLPYDRPNTSMASFTMCKACRSEYEDPADRRFHAQPVACPDCGPSLRLLRPYGQEVETQEPLRHAARLLKDGGIVAIKGLGGFHIAVDACNDQAIERLRARKQRPFKPFAVMVQGLTQAESLAIVSAEAKSLLRSPKAPIVLLPISRQGRAVISEQVAPNLDSLGIMLAYTPIHHLLFQYGAPSCLVMTSGNLSGEPICKGNKEAVERLSDICDMILVHDRPIVTRLDDSVFMDTARGPVCVRRARGHVPVAIENRSPVSPSGRDTTVLAMGADLKATVCLATEGQFVISQHLGEADRPETIEFSKETIRHLSRLLDFKPKVVACDLHPDYRTARMARSLAQNHGARLIEVQHHVAHAAAVAAEHGLTGPTVACVLDGAGYGLDGTIWGGEILAGPEPWRLSRKAHLEHLLLPGGDAAAREPFRMGAAILHHLLGKDFVTHPAARLLEDSCRNTARSLPSLHTLSAMLEKGINCPKTSSCGRLFDGVSALLGICPVNDYEGQAAAELEALARSVKPRPTPEPPPPSIETNERLEIMRTSPFLHWLVERVSSASADLGSRAGLALAFHRYLGELLLSATIQIARRHQITQVVLSGGCLMNRFLFNFLVEGLEEAGLTPWWGREVPMNDGGISLGQALVALQEPVGH